MESLQAVRASRPWLSRVHSPPGHLPSCCPRARAGQLGSPLGPSIKHAPVLKLLDPSSTRAETGWRIGAHSAVAEDRQLRRMPSRMAEFSIEGPVIAIVTPFKSDSLRVDDEALIEYLQYLWEHGIQNIIVNGTTAEFASMTMAERMEVTELAREYWPGTIVNNISAASHVDALQYLHHSQTLVKDCQAEPRKIEAALLLPPFYFAKATDAGLERWLRMVLEAAQLPVFLYNFPDHTGNFISPDLFRRLTQDFPLLRGIKNTFNDVPLAAKFKGSFPERQVYVGFDGAYLQALQAGLDGNVSSGGGAVLVDTFQHINKAHDKGDMAAAGEGQRKMDAWADCREKLGVQDLPAAKAALSGVIPGFSPAVRPPLLAATREQQQSLTDFVKNTSV